MQSEIDKRTGRAYGDHGTAMQAITYCLEELQVERDTFLKCWSEGDLDQWPEFYNWLAKQPGESALSTDAEPDGWICENDFTLEPDLAWEWEDKGLSPKPFYFSPQQNADPVKTAPAVAVKDTSRADLVSAINAKIVQVNERKYGKNRAQWRMLTTGEIVDAVIALSAQVQDVAEDPDALFWRIRIAYLRGAEWREQNGSMELAEKASYDYADKIISPLSASPASKHGDAE